jgi:hypothetical protein
MKTIPQNNRPILTQTENNTTLWVGNLKHGNNDHVAGQTFTCPSEGILNNIQIYSAVVTRPGEMQLTLHEFDNESRTWGPAICQSTINMELGEKPRWIRFELDPVNLKQNIAYGFRLKAPEALVGIGESVHESSRPFHFGMAWNGGNRNSENGEYFNYFSLAFKVELCA